MDLRDESRGEPRTPLHFATPTANLLAAATPVAESDQPVRVPAGEWNADQILGHIALVDAATIAAAAAIASGANTTYDNRTWLDDWTIARVIARVGGNAGLRERIRNQGEALWTLARVLSEDELDTRCPPSSCRQVAWARQVNSRTTF